MFLFTLGRDPIEELFFTKDLKIQFGLPADLAAAHKWWCLSEQHHMPIDEIKLQEHLRWDLRTNMILGVCREHGGECVLEFHTMEQTNHLVTNLVSEQVHMASEASCDPVFSISCSDYHGKCRQL
jgi:hypothetical protein